MANKYSIINAIFIIKCISLSSSIYFNNNPFCRFTILG